MLGDECGGTAFGGCGVALGGGVVFAVVLEVLFLADVEAGLTVALRAVKLAAANPGRGGGGRILFKALKLVVV